MHKNIYKTHDKNKFDRPTKDQLMNVILTMHKVNTVTLVCRPGLSGLNHSTSSAYYIDTIWGIYK